MSLEFHQILHLIFLLLTGLKACEIPSFDNVEITITTEDDARDTVIVNGCIDPKTIPLSTREILCGDQQVPFLAKGAISNLPDLTKLILKFDGIAELKRGAFLNLRRLDELDLSGNALQQVPTAVFTGLSVRRLDLKENEIDQIWIGAFADMPNLEFVNLVKNKLQIWNSDWFRNTPRVNRILLGSNGIRKVSGFAFKNLPKLSTIVLRNNKISAVHQNAFQNLTSLEKVDLSNNRLSNLHPDLFLIEVTAARVSSERGSINRNVGRVDSKLQHLYIQGNNFTYIPARMLETLKGLKYLNLHSNPWQCPCFNRLMEWAHRNKVTVDGVNAGCIYKNNPVCVISLHTPNECVERNEEELQSAYYANFVPLDQVKSEDVYCT